MFQGQRLLSLPFFYDEAVNSSHLWRLAVDLNFLRLVVTLRLETDVTDPYLLFGMRTDFAKLFREVTSCRREVCQQCPDAPGCPCLPILSQRLSTDPSAVRRFQKPPLPFAFALPQ